MDDHLYSTEDLERMNATLKNIEDKLKRTHTVALPPEVTLKRMHNTSGFPDEPISPATLASKVIEKLNSFPKVVAPVKTSTMVEELCRSFNECIRLNKEGESQTLILSPKTGSAKSVSSKMYVSLLQEHASIIVVYTVKEAIDTCEDINAWSRDNNYARCTYRISEDNEKNPLRVDKSELEKFRCIVISHALFKLKNDNEEIENFSKYNGKKRELVLIDERIDLYREVSFPLSNLKYLSKLFKDIKESIRLSLVDNEIEYLDTIQDSFDGVKELKEIKLDIDKNGEVIQQIDSKGFIYMDGRQREESNIESYDFNNFYKLLDKTTIDLQKVIDPLSLLDTTVDKKTVHKNLKDQLGNLSKILKEDFYYFAQSNASKSPVVMTTENILNSFGSSVVLDATATVNALYDDKVHENYKTVKHITTTDPRKYNNFTIYKCKGIPQGKGSTYKNLAQKDIEVVIDIYKSIVDSIMGKEDKLLILTHKGFKDLLIKKIKRKGVEFTHWGNHRGKNDWSHCNKILVIGWNFLPTEVHYRNYINAINGTYDISNDGLKEVKSTYEMTQMVDDLVQGVNRGAVRKSISTDGDCTKSEVYLFYPSNVLGETVMKYFTKEFKGAKVIKNWNPKEIKGLKKLAKNYDNIERVANYIERKVKELGSIRQTVVQKYFNEKTNAERLMVNEDRMARSTVSNAMKHAEFTLLLQTKGIHRAPYDGKSYKYEKIS